MKDFMWDKNTVEIDPCKPMLKYHEYVDVQQRKDFELTGCNVRRDKENYQRAYGSYCDKYRLIKTYN